jgi:hypothetical protein
MCRVFLELVVWLLELSESGICIRNLCILVFIFVYILCRLT